MLDRKTIFLLRRSLRPANTGAGLTDEADYFDLGAWDPMWTRVGNTPPEGFTGPWAAAYSGPGKGRLGIEGSGVRWSG